MTVVLTHGLEWRHFIKGDRIVLPEKVWAPFENPNLHLELLFPIALGAVWDYPMIEVQSTIAECVERLGADRLMWGTDMPLTARYCTYKQSMDQFRTYCDFLSDSERAYILGGTTARVMRLN